MPDVRTVRPQRLARSFDRFLVGLLEQNTPRAPTAADLKAIGARLAQLGADAEKPQHKTLKDAFAQLHEDRKASDAQQPPHQDPAHLRLAEQRAGWK